MYKVLRTPYFNKRFDKIIPKNLQEDIKCRILKFSENPYNGKPLGNSLWEMKAGKFRRYYIISNSQMVVLFVDVSDKKNQQEIIDMLKEIDFRDIIENYKNMNR